MDSPRRSIVKTLSWRLVGSLSTFAISFFMLGNITIAGTIAILQFIANTILYYIHERIWNKIKWGSN